MDKEYQFLQRNTLFQFLKSSIPAVILMVGAIGLIFPTGARGAKPVPTPVEFIWDGDTNDLFSVDNNWDNVAPTTSKNVEDINTITFNSGDIGNQVVTLDQGAGGSNTQPIGLINIEATGSPSFIFNELTDDNYEYLLYHSCPVNLNLKLCKSLIFINL